MRNPVLALLLLFALLGACRRDEGQPPVTARSPAPAGPSRVLASDDQRLWQGVMPCRDCLGIDTRLLLSERSGQRRFTLQEIYVGTGNGKPFERSGDWIEATQRIGKDDMILVVLDPDGAATAIRQLPDGTLELLGPEGRPAPDGASLRLHRQSF
jgi:copper homeostasis protein (lipoprotein)